MEGVGDKDKQVQQRYAKLIPIEVNPSATGKNTQHRIRNHLTRDKFKNVMRNHNLCQYQISHGFDPKPCLKYSLEKRIST